MCIEAKLLNGTKRQKKLNIGKGADKGTMIRVNFLRRNIRILFASRITGSGFFAKRDLFSFGIPTICPRSICPLYKVTCYMKWVTTSWTFSTIEVCVIFDV